MMSTMPSFLQNYREAQQMFVQFSEALAAVVQADDVQCLPALNERLLVCFGQLAGDSPWPVLYLPQLSMICPS
jgi:hypothetical protein